MSHRRGSTILHHARAPWLRLHLFVRDVLATPWGKEWPNVRLELERCGVAKNDDVGRVVQLSVR